MHLNATMRAYRACTRRQHLQIDEVAPYGEQTLLKSCCFRKRPRACAPTASLDSVAMQISVCQRYVIEFATKKGNTQYWIPADGDMRVIDGVQFVALRAKDRGFAKFCGADMSQTSPLKKFKWLHTATTARTQAMRKIIDKCSEDQVLGWKQGQRVNAPSLSLPETVNVALPMVNEATPAMTIAFASEPDSKRNLMVPMEPATLAYVRGAMFASKSAIAVRSSTRHADRMSAQTGIRSVWKSQGGKRLVHHFMNEDGKKQVVSAKAPRDGELGAELEKACKRLKTMKDSSPVKNIAPKDEADVTGEPDDATSAPIAPIAPDDSGLNGPDMMSTNSASSYDDIKKEMDEVVPSTGMNSQWKSIFNKQ